MKYGFFSSLNSSAQATLWGALRQASSGDFNSSKRPPSDAFNFSQLAGDGHSGSPGRTRRTIDPEAPAPADTMAEPPAQTAGIAAAVLRNCRRFIALARLQSELSALV